MAPQVIVRPEAERDISAAVNWYDTQRAGIGERLLDETREIILDIQLRSKSFPSVYR